MVKSELLEAERHWEMEREERSSIPYLDSICGLKVCEIVIMCGLIDWSLKIFPDYSYRSGSYQMSRPTCLNKANEKEVDERLCDIAARPLPEIKECNSHKCPPV
ncbi:ADAMTS-like protein 1 [Trichonephila clavipes]|nr:ADAMTS-like protein 1 [Trichonephila clavipes]